MDCHQADAAEQSARRSACNDRRVLNGIFWVLRSGAPWRDLPETYGPVPRYNRFVRWRRAGVWDQIMDTLAAGACPREAALATSPRCAVQLLVPDSASATLVR